ncbi:MAG: hypothetical protein ACRC5M_00205 [Anaeroplasmataceae bacterium]
MDKKIYTEDDYCDLKKNKICDNCGECLEQEGVDIRAINIEDIAKTVEENEFLEAELKRAMEEAKRDEDAKEDKSDALTAEEFLGEEIESEYIDAFENIEYLDDVELFDELNLEEMTEEIFPGVRRLKAK